MLRTSPATQQQSRPASGAIDVSDFANLPVRDDLRGQSPYGAPQLDVPIRLNTNENPHGPSSALVARIGADVAAAAVDLNRYPDREGVALRSELADYLTRSTGVALDHTQVWAANGSNEILQQVLQTFGGPGRTALGFGPTYSMHALISRGTGTTYVERPRRADFAIDVDDAVATIEAQRPDVVFVCSPNNPTATAVDDATIAAIYDAVVMDDGVESDRGIVVVDEAYAEFSHRPSAIQLLEGRPRLLVTRTMSKAFAFAGARVGYVAADAEVIDALQLVRLPYHLSALTQAAARAALAFVNELLGTVDAVKAQRDRLVREIRGLGCTVVESDANFVLFGGFPPPYATDQGAVWKGLVERGVLVRDLGLDGWLRVTAGTEDEVTAFLTALTTVLAAATKESA